MGFIVGMLWVSGDFGGSATVVSAKRRAAHKGVCAIVGTALAGASIPSMAQTYGPEDTAPSTVTTAPIQPAALPQPLLDAVATSLSQNPQVLAGLAELAALNSDLSAAKWQRFPNLSAEILATTGGSNAADVDGLAVNLALEQPIWTAGRINNSIEAARTSRNIGRTALREVRFDILLAITNAYYEALLAFERVDALETGLEEMRLLAQSIERRVAQEVSPASDLRLARSRLTQLEVEITSARELGDNAMLRLEELVGGPVPRPVFPNADLTPTLPAEEIGLQEAMSCSPRLERLRGEIDLADAQRRVTRSGLFPQLLVQLSQNELTGARAALALRWQTGNGLSQLAATESAKARVERAIALLGQADQEMRRLSSTEYVALRSSQRREEAGLMALDAATELLASYRRQFVAGRRSWLDVMNAAREKTFAAVSHRDARVNVAGSATRILALSCYWRPQGI